MTCFLEWALNVSQIPPEGVSPWTMARMVRYHPGYRPLGLQGHPARAAETVNSFCLDLHRHTLLYAEVRARILERVWRGA